MVGFSNLPAQRIDVAASISSFANLLGRPGAELGMAALLLVLASVPASGQEVERQTQVQVGGVVQFELPSDWVVVDAEGRTRIDAYVLQFAPKAASSLGFAAESPDQRVNVNVRLLPTGANSQSQLLQLQPSDLAQGRTMLEESLRQNLGNAGMSLLGLDSLSVSQVGDLQALYTMARRTHPSSAEPWTLEQFQVWDGPSSFTLTVSYAASAEATASRVIQRIRQTAR